MIQPADDTANSIVSKKSTSPAVMSTSRLVLPCAMTWTEKSACVANLATLTQAHTRAIPAACCCYGVAVSRLILVLLLQLPIALSSLITCNEKTKEKKKLPKKQRKQRTSGRLFAPTANFLVGNYGLRRADRWDDMPSLSSEVGET